MYWIAALLALMWLVFIASLARRRRREAQQAATYVEKARVLMKKSEEVARAKSKLKRLDDAAEQLQKALKVRRSDPTAKKLLAQCKAEREALAAQSSREPNDDGG